MIVSIRGKLGHELAYDGNYKAYFEFIADSLKRYSSHVTSRREKHSSRFTLAMTSQNQFYRPISELDNDGGYADIFLYPLCDIYKEIVDTLIIELKYCKTNTADEQLQVLFKEASAQICRYANSDIVKESVKTTKLPQARSYLPKNRNGNVRGSNGRIRLRRGCLIHGQSFLSPKKQIKQGCLKQSCLKTAFFYRNCY